MAEVKSSGQISEKWGRVTPQRTQDYSQGVQQPRRDWAQATGEAAERYQQGIQEAIGEGRFQKGVQDAGSQKWARKTQELGTRRWGPGVQAAQDDYQRGFEPYRQAIEATNLPPRYPKGDPRNLERVGAIAKALHAKKLSG
jgi:hypothetical protein